jgi:hypothetical protein
MKNIIIVLMIFSCFTNADEFAPKPSEIVSKVEFTVPVLGDVSTIYTGEELISRGTKVLERKHFYRVKKDFKDSCCFGAKIQIENEGILSYLEYVPRWERSLFSTNFPTFIKRDGTILEYPVYFEKTKKGVEVGFLARTKYNEIADLTFEEFNNAFEKEYADVEIIVPESNPRTIEYIDKSGDILTFLYVEYSGTLGNNYAKPAFTRKFTVDISNTNMGGFKGFIFEIVNVTQFDLTYKIIKDFP